MRSGRSSKREHDFDSEDALFRVVASSATDSIVSIDENSKILFANKSTERMFGYVQHELVGHQLTKLMPDYLRHLHEAAIARYLATGEKHLHWGAVELPGLHSNGREIPLELSFGESVEGDRRIFTGIIRDVSERKRLERRWEAQYAIARTLASSEDLERVTLQILEAICNCLDWQVGVFWQPGDDGQLDATSAWHDPSIDGEAFLDATRRLSLPSGVGVPGRVWSTNEPLWLADVECDDNYPRHPFARAAGLHAVFAFPVNSAAGFLGVMEFYSAEIREPDATLLNLMKSTAVQIGQFVQRRRAEEELVELNRELEQRVLERTAQLQESSNELQSFVYSVSHDLRAPLRGIDGFSQLLLDDYGSKLDGVASEFLLRIKSAAGRMGNLIDSLLDLSRISRSELSKGKVKLSSIADKVINELEQRDRQRKVDVTIAPGVTADGDPVLLRILLENLLGNSWKFTARTENPRIEFAATVVGAETVFYVRDNGAGFDMAYADKLFKSFQRLHSPAEFEGTGIGLTTVQRIVQRHGGRIWVEAAVGRGATFFFTL